MNATGWIPVTQRFEDSPFYVPECDCAHCMRLKGTTIRYTPDSKIDTVEIVNEEVYVPPPFTPDYTDLFTVMQFPEHTVRACKAIRQATGCSLYVATYIVRDYWMERNKRIKNYNEDSNGKEYSYPSITPHAMLRSFGGFMEQFVEILPQIWEATDISKDVLAANVLFKELKGKVQAMGLGWSMRQAVDELGFIEQSERDTPEFDNEIPF